MQSNPVLNRLDEYEKFVDDINNNMTVRGTMICFFLLSLLALMTAIVSWNWYTSGAMQNIKFGLILGLIFGVIAAPIISFFPRTAPYLSPIYAVSEGTILGCASAMFEASFPGIAIQAVAATFITLFTVIALYRTNLVKVTAKFMSILTILLFSIFILYIVATIAAHMGYLGLSKLIWGSSPISIGISCLLIVVGAASLLADIAMIERYSSVKAPAYMNWYCAFGLLVTMIWLYMEFLKLLAKLNSRRN